MKKPSVCGTPDGTEMVLLSWNCVPSALTSMRRLMLAAREGEQCRKGGKGKELHGTKPFLWVYEGEGSSTAPRHRQFGSKDEMSLPDAMRARALALRVSSSFCKVRHCSSVTWGSE